MDGRIEQLQAELQAALERVTQLQVELQRASRRDPPGTVPHYNVIEDAGRALGAEVSRRTQQALLRELNAEHLRAVCCPGCGERCEVETRRRTVTALDGPVELDDLVAHCPGCRRDFFPSADAAGVRRPRAHAAGRAADRARRR